MWTPGTSLSAVAHIVVDSFILGNGEHGDLKTLSYLTGGLNFAPQTLEEALAICELEPVLSLLERPDDVPDLLRNHRHRFIRSIGDGIAEFRQAARDAPIHRVTEDCSRAQADFQSRRVPHRARPVREIRHRTTRRPESPSEQNSQRDSQFRGAGTSALRHIYW
ncbi:hypothetical protein IAQ61_011756 [Plenodomus lingam]|uniref:uncharacterized protein n=1 Tax=Leptosphaeria maculans TaxID=5022 RepID=UPI0033212F39|nr:hypothetical protein IAQ61_011756 [Plenodomus lingam]